MESFFGVEVTVGKPFKPKIPSDRVLHVSQMALPAGARDAVTFRVVLDGKSFTIATLDPKRGVYFMRLDFVVSPMQKVLFAADGPQEKDSVHITGFTQPNDDIEEDEEEKEEEEEEEEEEDSVDGSDEISQTKAPIHRKNVPTGKGKQLKTGIKGDGKSGRKRERR